MVMGFDGEVQDKLEAITECDVNEILSGKVGIKQRNGRKKFRVLRVKKLGEVEEKNGHGVEQEEDGEKIERRGMMRLS
jgi:hypothetical protein